MNIFIVEIFVPLESLARISIVITDARARGWPDPIREILLLPER